MASSYLSLSVSRSLLREGDVAISPFTVDIFHFAKSFTVSCPHPIALIAFVNGALTRKRSNSGAGEGEGGEGKRGIVDRPNNRIATRALDAVRFRSSPPLPPAHPSSSPPPPPGAGGERGGTEGAAESGQFRGYGEDAHPHPTALIPIIASRSRSGNTPARLRVPLASHPISTIINERSYFHPRGRFIRIVPLHVIMPV